mmetsp:Transcript_113341/g.219529  ORF Transcript_113341/g.219529 Transcript_113341/m.219529 type:complete len:83 (-) Transcript_113341:21-269(-)
MESVTIMSALFFSSLRKSFRHSGCVFQNKVEASHRPRFASPNGGKDRERCCDKTCFRPRYQLVQPQGHKEFEAYDTSSRMLR